MANALPNKVTVKLPWIEGEWLIDDKQRSAAWELYVELITRVAVQPLAETEGLVREALSSLYALFGETRRILRTYGPAIAIPKKATALSFGQLAVDLLNRTLRPFLAKWHPILQAYETDRPPGRSPLEHERNWSELRRCREELETMRLSLAQYADLLASASGVPPLHEGA